MAIQNATYLPNRITKKKYFYDPSLEKGILNAVHSLGRDSSLDNEHYKGICFCPSNYKLYTIRRNSSNYVTKVDVVCPISTLNTHEPYVTISVDSSGSGSGAAITYCPSVDRIFAACESKINVIDPRTNQVEIKIDLSSGDIYDISYFPNTNKLYVSHGSGGLTIINPGKITNNGQLTGVKTEENLNSILSGNSSATLNYLQVTGVCGNPNKNYLNIFDSTNMLWTTSHMNISATKENFISHEVTRASTAAWIDIQTKKPKDVIYCPFDDAEYWLSSMSGIYDTYIYRDGDDYFKVIKLKGEYNKLVYCPDNNMIYVLGDNTMQMINPADTKGTAPVSQFFDENLGIPTNAVCYSPFMNRIYGVGNNGYIKYIDPTT